MHLFPNIGLDVKKFKSMLNSNEGGNKANLQQESNLERRKFFEDFAKAKGFDPLHPQPWYSITWSDIQNYKVCRVLKYG